MAILHEYAESNSKDGYYLRQGYDGTVITYQVPKFAENLLLNLGYDDKDRIAREVFYILLNLDLIHTNQSGVEPVKSLDDLPTLEDNENSPLSDNQREYFVEMLIEYEDLTPELKEKLIRYASSDDLDGENQRDEIIKESKNNGVFESRVDDYDEYMLAVDMARLLKPAAERLDVPENPEESELISELESAEERRDELYKKCKKYPQNLRVYRDEQGIPDEVAVLKKSYLNENGITFPTGDGEEIKVSYDIPAKDHDIVIPKNWTAPPMHSKSDAEDNEIRFEDLSEETQERLMNRARKEVLNQVAEFLEEL